MTEDYMKEKLNAIEILARAQGNMEGIAEGLAMHEGFASMSTALMDCAEALDTVMTCLKKYAEQAD